MLHQQRNGNDNWKHRHDFLDSGISCLFTEVKTECFFTLKCSQNHENEKNLCAFSIMPSAGYSDTDYPRDGSELCSADNRTGG